MGTITLSEYQRVVKKQRSSMFKQPFELVFEQFIQLGLDRKNNQYFTEHASDIVQQLRKRSWEAFIPVERSFTSAMLQRLVDPQDVAEMSAFDAISWVFNKYPDHIYQLTLSNTQSRRSRAGKEFEAIIELVLLGAGIPLDTQGNVGTSTFTQKGLGKLVDIVSPGVVEYTKNKRKTHLISAKTTLRERWQEVPEELGRTGAGEMLLVTLDPSVSKEVLEQLYEQNIQLVTTRSIKDGSYTDNDRVLTFEDMIAELKRNNAAWDASSYSSSEVAAAENLIEVQLAKHKHHGFVYEKYLDRKKALRQSPAPQTIPTSTKLHTPTQA